MINMDLPNSRVRMPAARTRYFTLGPGPNVLTCCAGLNRQGVNCKLYGQLVIKLVH